MKPKSGRNTLARRFQPSRRRRPHQAHMLRRRDRSARRSCHRNGQLLNGIAFATLLTRPRRTTTIGARSTGARRYSRCMLQRSDGELVTLLGRVLHLRRGSAGGTARPSGDRLGPKSGTRPRQPWRTPQRPQTTGPWRRRTRWPQRKTARPRPSDPLLLSKQSN